MLERGAALDALEALQELSNLPEACEAERAKAEGHGVRGDGARGARQRCTRTAPISACVSEDVEVNLVGDDLYEVGESMRRHVRLSLRSWSRELGERLVI